MKNANTNGFDKRPDQAGRPTGRKNNSTLMREALQAKGLQYENPDLYLMNLLIEILQDPQTRQGVKLSAINSLFDRLQGKPRQTAEIKNDIDAANIGIPVINTQESNAENFINICEAFGVQYIAVDSDDHKKAIEKLKFIQPRKYCKNTGS